MGGLVPALILLSLPARAQNLRSLSGHVPKAIARLNLQPAGALAATNRLHLAIGLPLHNQSELGPLLKQLYDPASPNYHRYLTPAQFNERFGPTAAEYQTVLNFLTNSGFSVIATFENHHLVDVLAAVPEIERAFHVRMLEYQHPVERRAFYAPDVEPSVEASVPILSISGINNYAKLNMLHRQMVNSASGIPNGTGSGSGGTYIGEDFRNAYVAGVTNNGAGQYLGLVELDGFYSSDITTYLSDAGIASGPPIITVHDSGSSGFPDNNTNGVAECSIDIELAISMAPGLAGLYVIESDNIDDALNTMASSNFIKQCSSSWSGSTFDSTGDSYLLQMALQGQSFFQASGDGDAYTQAIEGPSDSTNAVSCGGTTLTTGPKGAYYISETVWNTGFITNNAWGGNGAVSGGGYWGSGGGVSSSYPLAAWQGAVNMTAVGGSTSHRDIPDVAMVASDVFGVYYKGLKNSFIGTSIAAPLWAAFTSLVNQQAAASGLPSVGFLAPALYTLGGSGNYDVCFNDITTGNNFWPGSPSEYSAAIGYDLCTGWGTPKGAALINALQSFAGAVYVDFHYSGSDQNGTFANPYNTIAAGVSAIRTRAPRGTIVLEGGGSSAETLTISNAMTIITIAGPTSIGD